MNDLTLSNNNLGEMVGFDDNDFIGELTSQSVAFTSIDLNSCPKDQKIRVFNAINSNSKRIKECVNMELKIKNVYVEKITCKNANGESQACPRIILLDEKDNGYCAVSIGVFNGLKKIFQIFGTPDQWEEPITIVPKTLTKGEKTITTLDLKI